ncbi:HBL/NHE enterotoxin family protein [Bacillus thuringiensis]|uniref:Hemolysin BL-binding component n=1 Tax=Bacillus thuringiensis HD-771 TaxID=1218175 RepID=A0A9W3JBL4_BACTU|nr:HBL/NHE enterotoxin family protein [Bacillus thuringiensis]EEM37487.1 Hemolysin BL-binding component [Bacillus thuringiensis serovar sotto str. T04001]AFQ15699.1 Hemolysin BL-binding component [Bacillus thuringiensis HD-771]MEB4894578.1 HBL/NHE enterotoxin family protein [Bacillus thuringiensis]MEC2469812.1 HBL/NHE enterotoxin family protein [Bacillus thuringiensis]MEC2563016.1 HBL/NHE enterotoxin family protein [Bacillus thuringiensis]
MNNNFPYKLLAVSTFLTLTTTTVVSPVAAFASESKIEQTSTEDISLSVNSEKMKKALQDAGVFAKSMNDYSYLLINNPDVNFEGIDIKGYTNLPSQIAQDQKNAREHATKWDTHIKKQLLDTLTGIVEYDTTFDNYYDTLIEAINEGDADTLKEGITDLQGEIKQNQVYAQNLIQELAKLRDSIGKDVRAFGGHKDILQSILKNQASGIDEDEKRLNDVLEQVRHFKQVESDGIITVSIPSIPTWIAGGVMIGVARDNLGTLEPLLAQLRQTVDYKITLNRVVGVAYNNIAEMQNAIESAINALTYMSAQWHDLDSQYSGVLNHIEKASQKADQNKFKFLKPNLNAAKDSWKTLRSDASTLKEGIKTLKMAPVASKK